MRCPRASSGAGNSARGARNPGRTPARRKRQAGRRASLWPRGLLPPARSGPNGGKMTGIAFLQERGIHRVGSPRSVFATWVRRPASCRASARWACRPPGPAWPSTRGRRRNCRPSGATGKGAGSTATARRRCARGREEARAAARLRRRAGAHARLPRARPAAARPASREGDGLHPAHPRHARAARSTRRRTAAPASPRCRTGTSAWRVTACASATAASPARSRRGSCATGAWRASCAS